MSKPRPEPVGARRLQSNAGLWLEPGPVGGGDELGASLIVEEDGADHEIVELQIIGGDPAVQPPAA